MNHPDKDEAKEVSFVDVHSDIADELLRQFEAMKSGTSASPAHVLEMDYVYGLQQLQMLIEKHAPTLKNGFFTLEARMLENLNNEVKYGATETVCADRARIVDALNELAERASLEPTFNDLCRR